LHRGFLFLQGRNHHFPGVFDPLKKILPLPVTMKPLVRITIK